MARFPVSRFRNRNASHNTSMPASNDNPPSSTRSTSLINATVTSSISSSASNTSRLDDVIRNDPKKQLQNSFDEQGEKQHQLKQKQQQQQQKEKNSKQASRIGILSTALRRKRLSPKRKKQILSPEQQYSTTKQYQSKSLSSLPPPPPPPPPPLPSTGLCRTDETNDLSSPHNKNNTIGSTSDVKTESTINNDEKDFNAGNNSSDDKSCNSSSFKKTQPWKHEPSLEPYVGKLERFELFQTNQCYYLVGCNKLNTAYRVLKLDRTLIERPPTTGATATSSGTEASSYDKSNRGIGYQNHINDDDQQQKASCKGASQQEIYREQVQQSKHNISTNAKHSSCKSRNGSESSSTGKNDIIAQHQKQQQKHPQVPPLTPSSTTNSNPTFLSNSNGNNNSSNSLPADALHTPKPTLRPLSEFLTEDPHVYSQDEIKEMLDMIHDGNRYYPTNSTYDHNSNSNSHNHNHHSSGGDNSASASSNVSVVSNNNNSTAGIGGLKPIVRAYGIVGFIRFLDCYYLTLITRRAKVGNIGGNGIYTIKNTETFPLKPCEHGPLSSSGNHHNNSADPSSVLLSMWNRGKRSVGLGLSNREIAELRYQGLYQVVDLTKNFYFSYTYDVTRSLQENFLSSCSQPFPPSPFKDMYAWNHYLTRELDFSLNSLTSYHWILPIIHGAFVQRKLNDYGRSLNLILIARRSRHFAGTRYLKRGVSEQGKVANDVEHEQILHDETKSTSDGIFSSYLQVRGSIPTFWTQESSVTMPKPPIELNRVDPTYTATQLHFEDLLKRYGSPMVVLDLVKQSEKREREVRVGNEYRHAIDYINTSITDPVHKIKYCALDYSHISKHRNLDVSKSLNEVSTWAVNLTGFFCSKPKWKILEGGYVVPFKNESNDNFNKCQMQRNRHTKAANNILTEQFGVPVFPMEQNGILRTNCIDCLDRTNVAQFSAGVEAIEQQLVVMGIRSNATLDPSSNTVRVLIDMYVDIGDSVALQYGGSEAHKKVSTERADGPGSSNPIIITGPMGKHKELLTSIRRYYSNAFTDRLKQDAMNLFLGYYVPHHHTIPLWEMESDYYLHNFHVKTGKGTLHSMKAYQRAYGLEWKSKEDMFNNTTDCHADMNDNNAETYSMVSSSLSTVALTGKGSRSETKLPNIQRFRLTSNTCTTFNDSGESANTHFDIINDADMKNNSKISLTCRSPDEFKRSVFKNHSFSRDRSNIKVGSGESLRIVRVRHRCMAQKDALSLWWKAAIQSNIQQRMWMQLGRPNSTELSLLPPRFERLYQPDKIAQFDRFFARGWATPVRRSHSAQHNPPRATSSAKNINKSSSSSFEGGKGRGAIGGVGEHFGAIGETGLIVDHWQNHPVKGEGNNGGKYNASVEEGTPKQQKSNGETTFDDDSFPTNEFRRRISTRRCTKMHSLDKFTRKFSSELNLGGQAKKNFLSQSSDFQRGSIDFDEDDDDDESYNDYYDYHDEDYYYDMTNNKRRDLILMKKEQEEKQQLKKTLDAFLTDYGVEPLFAPSLKSIIQHHSNNDVNDNRKDIPLEKQHFIPSTMSSSNMNNGSSNGSLNTNNHSGNYKTDYNSDTNSPAYLGCVDSIEEKPREEYLRYVNLSTTSTTSNNDNGSSNFASNINSTSSELHGQYRLEVVDEFQAYLEDFTLKSDDVHGIRKLAGSGHIGRSLRHGPYRGLAQDESAIEIATAIHEQFNALESMRSRNNATSKYDMKEYISLIDTELRRRRLHTSGVKETLMDGWDKRMKAETQYTEILTSSNSSYRRSDLTTSSSLQLYASVFDENTPLSISDLIFMLGGKPVGAGVRKNNKETSFSSNNINLVDLKKSSDESKRIQQIQSKVDHLSSPSFVEKASRLGISILSHLEIEKEVLPPLFQCDERHSERIIPTGFEQINEDMYARKDNKFMVFNGSGVDSWKTTQPVTKTCRIEDVLLSTLN